MTSSWRRRRIVRKRLSLVQPDYTARIAALLVVGGCLLWGLLIFCTHMAYAEERTCYVIGDAVRVRYAASTRGEVTGYLYTDDPVVVLALTEDSAWAEVRGAGDGSYISIQYLSERPVSEGPWTAVVNTNKVNMREYPSIDTASQGKLAKGTSITITNWFAGWCKISGAGWVMDDYLDITDQ